MDVYARLKELNITLPPANKPAAAFVMAAQTGNLVFVSGHIARREGKAWTGLLGQELQTEEGRRAARSVAIDLLATLHDFTGDLNRIGRVVKALCLVSSAPGFTEQHLVANGCSELLGDVLGQRGRHARSAIGVAQLPLGACVEVELIVELD